MQKIENNLKPLIDSYSKVNNLGFKNFLSSNNIVDFNQSIFNFSIPKANGNASAKNQSDLSDDDIDFTKVYEATPEEWELTKEDNPNAIGIGFDDNDTGEYTTETISENSQEGDNNSNILQQLLGNNANNKDIISLLGKFLQALLKKGNSEQ